MVKLNKWGLVAWVAGALLVVLVNWPREDWLLLSNRLINTQAVQRLGFGGYFFYDLIDTSARHGRRAQLGDEDPTAYREFLDSVAARRDAAWTPPSEAPRRKHVVYLQLESMDGLVVGGRKGGQPVMPFLESLAQANTYFTNAVDNTASGRTTDGEFLVLTSQVPVPRPPVFVSQHLDRIPSLPRVLNESGYRTISLHGFTGVFWHRKEAHIALGYDEMYFEEDLDLGEEIGWGWSDEVVLQHAAEKLIAAEQPTFLHVITLTNHHPYTYLAELDGRPPGRIEAEFLHSAAYVDNAVRGFFERLEEAGILDDCLIAIYGDHDSAIDDLLETYLDEYPSRLIPDTVPMVLVGFGEKRGRLDMLAGLQDIPVMVLQKLGLPVPGTFTGNGWDSWGRTISASHGAVRMGADGSAETWELPVSAEILTRLSINHPDKLIGEGAP
jgi:phosphoglycerol transferase MdoB-like AlkP superfamily enzyme